MVDTSKDSGMIQVLAARLESQRLPRALSLKERVDQGETLTDMDVRFLDEVLEDAQRIHPLVDRHPEWQPLAAKMLQLYKDITTRALENEQTKKSGS